MFTLTVKPGKFAEFRSLVADIVADSRKEPGFVAHVEQTFGRYAERFLQLVTIASLVVYGNPNATARKALDSFDATYMTQTIAASGARSVSGSTRPRSRSGPWR